MKQDVRVFVVFCCFLGGTLIILRALELITLSWAWCTAPFWIPFSAWVILAIIAMSWRNKKRK